MPVAGTLHTVRPKMLGVQILIFGGIHNMHASIKCIDIYSHACIHIYTRQPWQENFLEAKKLKEFFSLSLLNLIARQYFRHCSTI